MKLQRQSKILQLIEQYDIETQMELTEHLLRCGFDTTQATVSPGSMNPARSENIPSGQPGERPSSTRLPRVTSMMTTGSVRGKCWAVQLGQRRAQPARNGSVGVPQFAQKRWRRCQSVRLRAAA